MEVRPYLISDFDQIAMWAREYKTEYSPELFPKVGFIVDGVAAYFIYQTDSAVCYLENLISNKNASADDKEKAINLLVAKTLEEAAALGFKVAYATTGISEVITRALINGALSCPRQTLLIKNLTQL